MTTISLVGQRGAQVSNVDTESTIQIFVSGNRHTVNNSITSKFEREPTTKVTPFEGFQRTIGIEGELVDFTGLGILTAGERNIARSGSNANRVNTLNVTGQVDGVAFKLSCKSEVSGSVGVHCGAVIGLVPVCVHDANQVAFIPKLVESNKVGLDLLEHLRILEVKRNITRSDILFLVTGGHCYGHSSNGNDRHENLLHTNNF